MPSHCLNCNKVLPKGVQSSFCSRACWQEYKERKGMAIDPERQATIMIKDTSHNLVSSLKSEIDKKNEIISHQDKLIQEYRDGLESRERDLSKLKSKLRYFEGLVSELRKQVIDLSSQPSKKIGSSPQPEIPTEKMKGEPRSTTFKPRESEVSGYKKDMSSVPQPSRITAKPTSTAVPVYATSVGNTVWRRFIDWLRWG